MRRLLLLSVGSLTAVLSGDAAWATARQAAWVVSSPVSGHTVDALDAAAAAVLAPAAWLLLGWLGVVAALAGLAAGPGRGSASASRLLARLAPSVLRRAAAGLAGASLAAGAWAAPAFADPSPAPAPQSTSFDWGPPAQPAPAATPAPAPPAAPSARPHGPAGEDAAITVRPGDCLWQIAAESLASTGAAPTTAEIAAAWPRWYAANQSVIGADPGLIHPGQRLTPPDPVPTATQEQ
jgi:hypothetical protein